ncbi:MAG: hypothetical protein JSS83_17020 [Cyanobacteria bacterium SZAS LIN-3]|nr:hypothetical protein [Cyanobacteria bacterium SZAS LIN-3]MBS2010726.1 hypothetical protein [Cyanobacteria bacterium SZAS TMP-1]
MSSILRHISLTPIGIPFCTRDCLKYGSRGAVDKALYRCVKDKVITRLTNGVFMRMDSKTPLPSPLKLARLKCHAFGKEIVEHGADIGVELQISDRGSAEPTFYVNGSSSSFQYGSVRIHLKSASKKKMHLKESSEGRIVRALWHLGKGSFNAGFVDYLVTTANTKDLRRTLVLAKAWMPAWLADFFPTTGYPCPLNAPAQNAHFIDYFNPNPSPVVMEKPLQWLNFDTEYGGIVGIKSTLQKGSQHSSISGNSGHFY